MKTPASPHFLTLALGHAFNAGRTDLPESLRTPARFAESYGDQTIRGIPFAFGLAEEANVVLLVDQKVSVDLSGAQATYVLFVHVVEDAATMSGFSFAGDEGHGYRLGGLVSEYELEYHDGSTASIPIFRRFAIQQARYGWGSAPFACVAALDDEAALTEDEARSLERVVPASAGPIRNAVALNAGLNPANPGQLWIYALKNPKPKCLCDVSCFIRVRSGR